MAHIVYHVTTQPHHSDFDDPITILLTGDLFSDRDRFSVPFSRLVAYTVEHNRNKTPKIEIELHSSDLQHLAAYEPDEERSKRMRAFLRKTCEKHVPQMQLKGFTFFEDNYGGAIFITQGIIISSSHG